MKKLALFLSVLLIAVTLAVPASAAVNFTPSVEQKPAPTVDPITIPTATKFPPSSATRTVKKSTVFP